MKIQFATSLPETQMLILPVEKGGLDRLELGDTDTRALLVGAAEASRFEGDAGATVEVFTSRNGKAARTVLLGIGSGNEGDYERAGGAITARYLSSGVETAAVDFDSIPAKPSAQAAARFAAAMVQRSWRHDIYRTKEPVKAKPTLATVTIAGAPEGTEAAYAVADAITQGMAFTRELVAEPANVLYPESFVERAQHLKEFGVEIDVLDEQAMRDLGMLALLGVAQGSRKAPRLLVMRWNGKGDGANPDLALVGKGVTFDSGGISLKPGAGMEDMKWDMGGAGAVAGTMKALALRKARANVIGVCGLVENMPDGNAQRPGDVVKSMSGQTIEVINTDAEGRLVLCDALHWVQETHKPKTIIDLATLTGAMIVALGHDHAGIFSNDDALADGLIKAGLASGDKLWRLPVNDTYNKLLDSQIADMKNVGPRAAGSITAAQFLQRFIQDGVRWAHLDIAGMAWSDKPGAHFDKGATGFGVRVLDRYVADNLEK
ncbi:leucyl aminopeptidase [Stakelama saccharophila]|uniref:Probable cytosol aminopeptidase n=1 Tax=Stakelama saccharophila TaxID=3075605 RepID=A0ABZ0BCH7_9SPHN|nr:leucyl aminopeptidase [Stakelama sp. W311]WNO55147.1 leucyl aminopeptidase [Stakelama sp. W311]